MLRIWGAYSTPHVPGTLCEFEGCTDLAYYGIPKQRLQYCKEHRLVGMFPPETNICCVEECIATVPRMSTGHDGTRMLCANHEQDPELNPLKVCKAKGCTEVATHQKGQGRIHELCVVHKLDHEWMFVCTEPTCIRRATHAWPDKDPTRCAHHYDDGMKDPIVRECAMCTKKPSFGRECRMPTVCASHNYAQYYNVRTEYCRDGCSSCAEKRSLVLNEETGAYRGIPIIK